MVDEIESYGAKAVFFDADLGLSAQVHHIVPFVVNHFGQLDFAFNSGETSGENGFMIDQTEENFDRVLSVNVKSSFVLLQDEIRQMIWQSHGGSIVNAASVSGLVATPKASHYAASKPAVLGPTKAAAIEYGQYGIRVNAVSPGASEQPSQKDTMENSSDNKQSDLRDYLAAERTFLAWIRT